MGYIMSTAAALPLLSKSKYVLGCQCLKRLWLEVNEPQLAGEFDDATQAVFDQGNKVGELAREAFAGGALVDETSMDLAIARTRKLMADPDMPAMFEAGFSYRGIRVRVDVLERASRGRWRLIEVKSSSKVKEDQYPGHLEDVAIQKYVLDHCKVRLASMHLMHLNTDYVYKGADYDLDDLFTIANVSADIKEAEKAIGGQLRKQRAALRQDHAPEVVPGRQCTTPYACDFYDHCNDPVPDGHVSQLPRVSRAKLDELEQMGVELIRDIPADFDLKPAQHHTADAVQAGKLQIVGDISARLDKLIYPVYFLDFETINPALPRWPGTRPFQQVPFQFSVHIQDAPGKQPRHVEFLADGKGDPQPELLKQLLAALEGDEPADCKSAGRGRTSSSRRGGARNAGSIVVYSSYENSCLSAMATAFPKHAKRIEQVQSRLWDLLTMLREHVYHPDFNGSWSLKSVAPVLTPMGYDDLDVCDGRAAGQVFLEMIDANVSPARQRTLNTHLCKYCERDTLTTVHILDWLCQQRKAK